MLAALSLLVKAALYIGALSSAGLALHSIILRKTYRICIVAFATILVFAVLVRLLLLNAELSGGLSGLLDFSMFGWIWAPNQAQVLTYLLGSAFLMLGAALNMRTSLIVGAILVFAGAGLGGHTHGLDTPGITPILVSVHVAIAAFWVTAPFVLWPRATNTDLELLNDTDRFSRVAVWCVPLLFLSGVWLALRLSSSLENLLGETYGRLLLLKLLLAFCALAIGAFNKFRVTQIMKSQAGQARVILKRALALDYVLFAGILLAVSAATTLTGPGA